MNDRARVESSIRELDSVIHSSDLAVYAILAFPYLVSSANLFCSYITSLSSTCWSFQQMLVHLLRNGVFVLI